jgi:hypothetical protein
MAAGKTYLVCDNERRVYIASDPVDRRRDAVTSAFVPLPRRVLMAGATVLGKREEMRDSTGSLQSTVQEYAMNAVALRVSSWPGPGPDGAVVLFTIPCKSQIHNSSCRMQFSHLSLPLRHLDGGVVACAAAALR